MLVERVRRRLPNSPFKPVWPSSIGLSGGPVSVIFATAARRICRFLPYLLPTFPDNQGESGHLRGITAPALTCIDPLVRADFLGRPRGDSNARTRLRRPLLYPLSYEGSEWASIAADYSCTQSRPSPLK